MPERTQGGQTMLRVLAVTLIFATGGTMASARPDGYLAVPQAGKGPGILVLHPWWGLNDTIKGVCDRLAQEGYVAYAPDLYHGEIATTIAEAETLSNKLDSARAKADVLAGEAYLREHAKGDAIGVLGFSLGANFAFALSVWEPEHVRAVVVFYGSGEFDFSKARAKYLGHYAETDPYEGEWVGVTENALKKGGRDYEFHTYKGTGHWFFEPDRTDAYRKEAADLAWKRTLQFYKRELH